MTTKTFDVDVLGFLQEAGLATGGPHESAEISVEEQASEAFANLERSGQTDLAARLRASFNGENPGHEPEQQAGAGSQCADVLGTLRKVGWSGFKSGG